MTLPVLLSIGFLINCFLVFFDSHAHIILFTLYSFFAYFGKKMLGNSLQDFDTFYLKGYIIDLIFAILMVAFWVNYRGTFFPDGTFSDSIAYMKQSSVTYTAYFKKPYFSDPGFYVFTHLIKIICDLFRAPNTYLVQCQILCVCGSLLRCYILMISQYFLHNKNKLNLIKTLLLFYPKIIIFSSGVLLRDTLIAFFISVSVYNYLLLDSKINRKELIICIIRISVCLVALFYFRRNLTYFFLMIIVTARSISLFSGKIKLKWKLSSLFLVIILLIASVNFLPSQMNRYEDKSQTYREAIQEKKATSGLPGSQGSLGHSLFLSGNIFRAIFLPAYNLVAPLPFFHGWIYKGEISITFIIKGLGGLFWQLLLGIWFSGILILIKRKTIFDIFSLTGIFYFLVFIAFIAPSVRYTYPAEAFLWIPIVVGFDSNHHIRYLWPSALLLMYALYLFLKFF